jgi:hypothetical protein
MASEEMNELLNPLFHSSMTERISAASPPGPFKLESGMDKTLAGVIGAVGALVATAPAQAATAAPLSMEAALQAGSYADLLQPIPNALALLKTEAAVQERPVAEEQAPVEEVQFFYHHHHHHHHHRRRHHHHHHHHH